MNFEGTYVAMVTPFDEKGYIDEEGFRSNINYLIEKGVNGLVGAGTTGESATITHEEHRKIIEISTFFFFISYFCKNFSLF